MEDKRIKKKVLTPREIEVMHLLIKGCHNSEIAQKLCISEHTTKAHISSILEKMHVSNRIQAIVRYLQEKNKIDILD